MGRNDCEQAQRELARAQARANRTCFMPMSPYGPANCPPGSAYNSLVKACMQVVPAIHVPEVPGVIGKPLSGFGNLGAKDWSKEPCPSITARYEQLKRLSTPAGGRSKAHQKEAAKAMKTLEPYIQQCARTSTPVAPATPEMPAGSGNNSTLPMYLGPYTPELSAVQDMIDIGGGEQGAGLVPMAQSSSSNALEAEGLDWPAWKLVATFAIVGGLLWFTSKKMSGQKISLPGPLKGLTK